MTIQHVRVAGTPSECSAFSRVPAPGQAGHALIGQNWDWLLHSAQTIVVLEVRQDDGPDFVTVVEAGLLMDLTAGQLWLAAGNPCQVPYEQLTVEL